MMTSRFSTSLFLGGLAAVALFPAGTARADDVDPRCALNGQSPLSLIQVYEKLVAEGYKTVRSIDMDDDGCVEVTGIDSAGRPFDFDLHPSTGAIVDRD
jgi:Peptidase propeptide and YPEB domain